METFLYGLAATAIAALAWLAYSHSGEFDRIAKAMLAIAMVFHVACGCWFMGHTTALSDIRAVLPDVTDSLSPIAEATFERWVVLFLSTIGFQAYVFVLWFLPNFLTLPKTKKE